MVTSSSGRYVIHLSRASSTGCAFPYVEIEVGDDGSQVYLIDARYLRRRPDGPADFGGAAVSLPD